MPVGDDRPVGAQPVVEQGPLRRGGPPAEAPCPRAPARRWAACPLLGMRLHPTTCGPAPRAGNVRRTGSQPRVTWTEVEASHLAVEKRRAGGVTTPGRLAARAGAQEQGACAGRGGGAVAAHRRGRGGCGHGQRRRWGRAGLLGSCRARVAEAHQGSEQGRGVRVLLCCCTVAPRGRAYEAASDPWRRLGKRHHSTWR